MYFSLRIAVVHIVVSVLLVLRVHIWLLRSVIGQKHCILFASLYSLR